MGLDIYAGTLTRYYAKNWKTSTQQWAEENGIEFHQITPEGENVEEPMSPAEVQEAVSSWRDTIVNGLSDEKKQFQPWEENNEKEYYTDKPDWEAYGALLLYAACRLEKKALPETVTKNWDYSENPLLKRVMNEQKYGWSLFLGTELWIPFEDRFSFEYIDPCSNEGVISTVGSLFAELKVINEKGWNADEETILGWCKTEGYPADAEVKDGKIGEIAENTIYNTESLAKFAFSIFYQAAKFATETGVPVRLDY